MCVHTYMYIYIYIYVGRVLALAGGRRRLALRGAANDNYTNGNNILCNEYNRNV